MSTTKIEVVYLQSGTTRIVEVTGASFKRAKSQLVKLEPSRAPSSPQGMPHACHAINAIDRATATNITRLNRRNHKGSRERQTFVYALPSLHRTKNIREMK